MSLYFVIYIIDIIINRSYIYFIDSITYQCL